METGPFRKKIKSASHVLQGQHANHCAMAPSTPVEFMEPCIHPTLQMAVWLKQFTHVKYLQNLWCHR